MTEATAADSKKGSGSFSIPSIVIDTLINSKASAYEICAYLTLARFTEESGRYSTASIREPLHKFPTHVLAHACRVRQHPSLCSNLILA